LLTTLSLKILAIFIRLAVVASEMRNLAKFSENSNLYRSSKVIDLVVNQKRICNFLLVIDSNFGRISYGFLDIDTFRYKIACFPHPTVV